MRLRILLSFIAVALAVAIWVFLPMSGSRTPIAAPLSAAPKPSTTVPGTQSQAPASEGKTAVIKGIQATAVTGSVPTRPMPPITTPLRLVYRDLKEQARAGNAIAQCRLGYELKRCSDVRRRAEALAGKSVSQKDSTAEDQPSIDAEVCRDFTPEPGDQAWAYTLQAALNGNETAAMNFISGSTAGLDPLKPLNTLDGWDAFRQYAPQLLQQQISRGNPAAFYIAAQNSIRPTWGIPIIPQDRIQAVAYALALMPSASASLTTQLQTFVQNANLSEGDLAQAQTMAAPLAGKLRVPTSGKTDFSSGILSVDGKALDASFCESRG